MDSAKDNKDEKKSASKISSSKAKESKVPSLQDEALESNELTLKLESDAKASEASTSEKDTVKIELAGSNENNDISQLQGMGTESINKDTSQKVYYGVFSITVALLILIGLMGIVYISFLSF